MSSRTDSARGGRLATYAALAGGVIPAGAAHADFVGETGIDVQVSVGASVGIDFGPGFGEVFRFDVNTDPDRGITSFFYTSGVIQFDNANSGGWTAASMINYPKMGAGGPNDPARLGLSSSIGPSQNWYGMTNALGTSHDLAARSFIFFTSERASGRGGTGTTGDWAPDLRGFVGLRFTKDLGANYQYAWIDVSVEGFTTPDTRGGAFAVPTMTIHAWGLETTPNEPVPAGTPAPGAAGLALLAMGAAGIRRSRAKTA